MGLHNTAHYLKSKGRGTDTELVHMSKREIKGLQQLAMAHGGSLTVNPDTGLVEAGFLEQALPIVAAAAATYFTAGAAAPLMAGALGTTGAGIAAGALAGAGISGITAAATGKDVGKAALMGGIGGAISGGMGAYDGAASADLLAGATQKTAETAGTEVAKTAAEQGATQVVADAGVGAGTSGYGEANELLTNAPVQGTGLSYNPGPGYGTGVPTGGVPTPAQTSGFMQGDPSQLSASQLGVSPNTQLPPKTFYQGLEPNGVGRGMVQMLPVAGLLDQEEQQQVGPEPQKGIGLGMSPNFQRYEPKTPNPYYRAKYPTYAAEGGIMQSYAAGGNVAAPTGPVEQMSQNALGGMANMYPQSQQTPTKFATPTQMPASSEMLMDNQYSGVTMAKGGLPSDAPRISDVRTFTDSDTNTRGLDALSAANYRNKKLMSKSGIKMADMPKAGIKSLGGDFSDVGAAGGTAHLGDYSDGGRLLKGPGDGMSDNIPATIGRKQPARLADGEFVVPADVVSHLGNGSTDAGAKKLYSMMDKIRRARTGKKKQAPAVKASKFMPA